MRLTGSIGLYKHALREVPREQVPEFLRPFLCIEDFHSDISILKLDTHELTTQCVKHAVSKFNNLSGKNNLSWWNKNNYPPLNVLWPNPILHNFRLAPKSTKHLNRLANLCKISSSHGISWDSLDNLYINFVKARDSASAKWNDAEPQIIDFASETSKKWITDWRMDKLQHIEKLEDMFSGDRLDKLKCPPTVHEKWIKLLLNRWKRRYFDLYSPGMLSKYLKAYVTLAMLKREAFETGETVSNLEFVDDPRNPCFKKVDVDNSDISGDFWDMQGVDEKSGKK